MTQATPSITKNRSNVRNIIQNGVQTGLRALSRNAPGIAERLALRLFMTPARTLPRAVPALLGVRARQMTLASSPYRLRVWSWGNGPTVLLVHGWSGQASQWVPFAEALVAAGYRVVAPDLPAHGFSSGRRTTLPDFVRAVRTVATHAGPLHGVIAHSLGATASTLALAAGMDAGRVVLIAPPADVPYYLRRLGALIGLPPERQPSLERRVMRRAGVSLESLNLRRVAPQLTVPALIVHSRSDREVPFSHGADLAQAWPGAALVALEGNSHTRVLAAPGVIALAVGFLGEAQRREALPPETVMVNPLPPQDDGDRVAYRAAL